jgi:hypothetical protein
MYDWEGHFSHHKAQTSQHGTEGLKHLPFQPFSALRPFTKMFPQLEKSFFFP